MTASFSKTSLISRNIRKSITGGTGVRKIDFSDLVERDGSGAGGIIGAIFNGGKALISFAAKSLFSALNFQDIVGWLIDTSFELFQFDWNQSDAELQALIQQEELQVYSQLGSVFGAGVGWLTSIALGYGIAIAVPVIGGVQLAKLAAAATADDAAADLFNRVKTAARGSAGNVARMAVAWLYMQKRRTLRSIPGLENWGRPEGPRFVIAEKYDDFVQGIPSDRLRAFVSGASNGLEDAFFDGLYIMAANLDDQVQAGREAADQTLGQQREIELYPDHRTDEKIVLQGPERLLKQQVLDQVSSHRRLADKDVGFIVGEDVRTLRRVAPQRRVLRVTYKNRSEPPWGSQANGYKRLTLQIPDLKNTSWEELKRVLKSYTWGRFYHTIPLDNGRKVMSHGATPAEAKENAERLLLLTTANALSNRISGEHDDSNKARAKLAIRMYPVSAVLEVKVPSPLDESAYVSPGGDAFKMERTKFDLWPASEPKGVPIRL